MQLRPQGLQQQPLDAAGELAQRAADARRRRLDRLLLFQARALDADLNDGEHDQDRRHHQRGGRRQTVFAEGAGEAVIVDEMHDVEGGRAGSAAGESEDHIKDLHRPYRGEDDDHQHRWRQQRQGNRAKGAPTAGAVDGGGFVEIGGYGLQAGQQNQRVEAHQRPDADHDHPEARPVAVGEEAQFLPAQPDDDSVEEPVLLQHPAPDQRDHDGREQDRIEEDAAEEAARPNAPVEHHRRQQRDANHDRDLGDDEAGGIQHGGGEQVFVASGRPQEVIAIEEALQIGGADIRTLIEEEFVAAREGVDEVKEHGEEDKYGKNQHIGRDENICHARHAGEALYAVEESVKEADEAVNDRVHD